MSIALSSHLQDLIQDAALKGNCLCRHHTQFWSRASLQCSRTDSLPFILNLKGTFQPFSLFENVTRE